jgi:hypothetical protein
MRALALALCMTVVVAPGASAAPWEVTRKGVIDPLNGAFHRHLPTYLRTRDLTALLGLYATETGTGISWDAAHAVDAGAEEEIFRWDGPPTVEPIRERWERLLALFPTIERAELRIDDVFWRAATSDGTPAHARLVIRGTRADGTRAQLEQAFAWRLAPRDGQWVISHEEVTARTLVARQAPRFEVVTDRAGVTNVHASDASPAFQLFGGPEASPVRASSGSAVADVDHDGCEDLVLAGNPELVLYRNHCDGTFEDWTTAAGLPRPYPAAATGVPLPRLRQRRLGRPVRGRRHRRRPPVPERGRRSLRRRERGRRHPARALGGDGHRGGLRSRRLPRHLRRPHG